MPSILLTRPSNFAEPLAAELEARGYSVFSEPLLAIAPCHNKRPDIENINAIMLTSRSAILALERMRDQIADLYSLPCFCIGEKTAQEARDFGFANVTASQMIFNKALFNRASHILHICGNEITTAPYDEIEKAGHKICKWVVYKAKATEELTSELIKNMKQRKIDVVLLFSPRTADIFASLAADNGLKACCKDLSAIGISEAVIAALRNLPLRQTVIAETPSEEAMIECLQRTFPNQRNP